MKYRCQCGKPEGYSQVFFDGYSDRMSNIKIESDLHFKAATMFCEKCGRPICERCARLVFKLEHLKEMTGLGWDTNIDKWINKQPHYCRTCAEMERLR